ncbi:FIST N-terminal domain-containing protein [Granulosicoccus sp. 3-233]|uniref:FIST N-terminal domain-containing protein n=1 Tax=Granulosicoccus sp. 3-233 TaxID=3417969 RepID=UPI003D329DC3
MNTSATDPVSVNCYTSGIQVLWSETANTDQLCSRIGDIADKQDIAIAIIWFSASRHAPEQLVTGLRQRSPTLTFCGCSTSGEVTPDGMQEQGFIAVLLPARWFNAQSVVMQDAASLGMENIAGITAEHRKRFLDTLPHPDETHTQFALLLIDGLSYSEETVTVAIDRGLDGIPLIGGSAGDDLLFEKTWQISNDQVMSGAAILTLIDCQLPFKLFTNNNFAPTEHKLVVTEADPDLRRVSEFNAEPAAVAYANAIGMSPEELDSGSFASYSVIVRFGGEHYSRSIQQLNEDMSLTFFCAIDNGLVMTVARSEGMVESSRQAIDALEQEIGPIDLIVGFDCIYRKLDARHRQTTHRIAELYREKRFVGFNTYGEQFNSMHINQTFTGIAIGTPSESSPEDECHHE